MQTINAITLASIIYKCLFGNIQQDYIIALILRWLLTNIIYNPYGTPARQ